MFRFCGFSEHEHTVLTFGGLLGTVSMPIYQLEEDMASISDLKFSTQAKPLYKDPVMIRRTKFMEKIDEQIVMVTRSIEGHQAPTAVVVEKQDLGGGVVPKQGSAWWWKEKSGRYLLAFKYGSKTLELSKGKPSVQCESLQEVKKVLETVFAAADKGELDSLLMSAGTELRKRFKS